MKNTIWVPTRYERVPLPVAPPMSQEEITALEAALKGRGDGSVTVVFGPPKLDAAVEALP